MCGWYYNKEDEVDSRNNVKISVLEQEIKHLDSIIEPEDCGHLITTKEWMKDRVRELKGLPEVV
tara:strand:+ start:276 stop:467 length:192 start_codon:yes stop_codon:yes gene_type:complete